MQTIIILAAIGITLIIFFIRAPTLITSFIGQGAIRVTIGILFLFFVNVFGGSIGLHIPINIFTVLISSVLGLFGVISLACIHLFLLM